MKLNPKLKSWGLRYVPLFFEAFISIYLNILPHLIKFSPSHLLASNLLFFQSSPLLSSFLSSAIVHLRPFSSWIPIPSTLSCIPFVSFPYSQSSSFQLAPWAKWLVSLGINVHSSLSLFSDLSIYKSITVPPFLHSVIEHPQLTARPLPSPSLPHSNVHPSNPGPSSYPRPPTTHTPLRAIYQQQHKKWPVPPTWKKKPIICLFMTFIILPENIILRPEVQGSGTRHSTLSFYIMLPIWLVRTMTNNYLESNRWCVLEVHYMAQQSRRIVNLHCELSTYAVNTAFSPQW